MVAPHRHAESVSSNFEQKLYQTRHVDGMPTSEVTPVINRYIHPPTLVTQRSMSWPWMDNPRPFRTMSIGHPFPEIGYFKLWPWNLKVKVMDVVKRQCYVVSPVPDSLLFRFTSIRATMSEIRLFWPWKIQGYRHGWGQSCIVHAVSNQRTSFSCRVIRTNHSWDMANSLLDLEKNPSNFEENFAKIISNRIPPKSNQVISMTGGYCYQVLLWLDECFSLYCVDKQLFLNQCQSHDLGSMSQKGHPAHFPRPIVPLSQTSKIKPKRF